MEFNGQYLKYEEYRSLGGTLDMTPFNLLEYEARRKIDGRTQNRLKNVEEVPQEVKICVFKLINAVMTFDEKLSKSEIASESIDGYSVSYVTDVEKVINEKSLELDNIIMDNLVNVVVNGEHVLFLGVK